MHSHPKNTQKCFTDGSRMNDGRAGASLVLDDGTERSFRLTDNTSICSTELTSIHESIRLAEERGIERMTIFSDSIGALRLIQVGSAADRPALLDSIYSALKTIQDRGLKIDMCWIPGHVGLVGNERADLLAKAADMNRNTNLVTKPELTELKGRVDDFILSKWQSRWREEKTGRQYFDLEPRISNQAKYNHKRRQQKVTITRLKVVPDEASLRQESLRQDSLKQRVAYRAPGFERSYVRPKRAQDSLKHERLRSCFTEARAPDKNLLKTT